MTAQNSLTIDLRELFAEMQVDVPVGRVTDISTRAQQVSAGGLFLACAGRHRHGLQYLDSALGAGAIAVAWEPDDAIAAPVFPDGVSGFSVPGLSRKLGVIADRFFRQPSAGLTVVGMTGTNGKTTSAYLVAQALRYLELSAGYMGTLGYGLGEDLVPSALTTPGCISVHRRLREMADQGAGYVIAEVSSHALDQGRVDGVRFQVAALTNLSREHLDYHGSLQHYAEAKAKLFLHTGIRTAVINIADGFGAELAGRLEPSTELVSVALVDADDTGTTARLRGTLTGNGHRGLGLELSGDFGDAVLESPLWGRFNAENLALAAGVLLGLGFPLEQAAAALSRCVAPPGRMELIGGQSRQPTVVVDFAHTPDALGQALVAAREHCRGKLWCVFGCGGDRDSGKRTLMGTVAADLADYCVVTDDNPRFEDPVVIVRDIVAGARHAKTLDVIHDRAAAIDHAIRNAAAGDVVLIAGKGHEEFQLVGDERLRFSDAVVARTALGLMA
jgi:UDP-N-acetylmuramoyl-L-alanyl-D-glutamate--2,6-diaminopimelate ligase